MAVTGLADGEPTKVGTAVADLASGIYAVAAIGAALYRRNLTGCGAEIEVSLLDTQISLLANQAMNWLIGQQVPQRLGNAHPNISPYESYQTEDRPIAIAVGTDSQYRSLTDVLGSSELSDARFQANEDRIRNRVELSAKIERVLMTRHRDYWLEKLRSAGVPAAPINEIPEVFADPFILERTVTTVGGIPQVRSPFRFEGHAIDIHRPPPDLGQDNVEVFSALGIRPSVLSEMRRRNAV